jgi:hypothetical protein
MPDSGYPFPHMVILYRALLERNPEPAGHEWWVTYLVGQLAVIEEACIDSPEFQIRCGRLFPQPVKTTIQAQDTMQIRF